MHPYEIVIVGGGPAGLSAALVLGRCGRRVLVCDSGQYRNQRSAALHCYLGNDGIGPAELLEQSRTQLSSYSSVSLVRTTVTKVENRGDNFTVRSHSGDLAVTRRLLIATGVVDDVPRIKGIDELYGRSVHVCPYCDGWEHRDAPIAVYGSREKGTGLALLLRQWTSDVVLCTGVSDSDRLRLQRGNIALRESPIDRLEGESGQLKFIHFDDGTRLPRQALFFNTGQHPRSPLLEQLGCSFKEDGSVGADENGETSVPGVFTAGDVSRDVQLAIIAAAEGARAALAVNKDLLKSDGLL